MSQTSSSGSCPAPVAFPGVNRPNMNTPLQHCCHFLEEHFAFPKRNPLEEFSRVTQAKREEPRAHFSWQMLGVTIITACLPFRNIISWSPTVFPNSCAWQLQPAAVRHTSTPPRDRCQLKQGHADQLPQLRRCGVEADELPLRESKFRH